MTAFTRTDSSLLGQWWWTVDRQSLGVVAALMVIGTVFIASASPPVAEDNNLPAFHFVFRHLMFLSVAALALLVTSLMSPTGVRQFAVILLCGASLGVTLTLFVGDEIKGATRWLDLGPVNVQPSEFLKPAFVVVSAWLIARGAAQGRLRPWALALALYAVAVGLLLLQPDFGMALVVSAVWGMQFVLAGLPMLLVIGLGLAGIGFVVAAYTTLPHVQSRIDRFLNPEDGDTYQLDRSIEAFQNGGLIGVGPGEGAIKYLVPDVHADFIFAAAGEEFGLIACLIVVGLFTFLVLRAFQRLMGEDRLFVQIAAAGLAAQFGIQALVNLGSSLGLIPTKGMTLPFISYGGSSLVAVSIAVGMLLALTRRRPGYAAAATSSRAGTPLTLRASR